MERVGILIGPRGRGSNMLALAARIDLDPSLSLEVVVCPRADSPGALAAKAEELNLKIVPYEPAQNYGVRLAEAFRDCDWICLAGYMKLVPEEVLLAHPRRVLNIHPALLPKFGGKGMYGHFVHEAVIAAGEAESGCTVHFVSGAYDEGAVILQSRCHVNLDDTPEDLAARVLRLEHETYFRALTMAIEGEVTDGARA